MKSDDEFRYDVFICYSHQDENWVQNWLLPRLELLGVVFCIDYRDFEPGAPSLTEMERAVLSSRKTLLVISQNYLESEWTEFEAVMAQTLDRSARQRRVIPLLLEKVDLPLRLGILTYLNFSNPEIVENQLKRLFQTTKVENITTTNPRVLVIENEVSWIKITKAILTDYNVDEVRTSAEGILKLKSGIHYDLVLTNLNLTDVNEASGEEVLEYIRDHRPSLPRIVVTGKPVRGPIYSTLFEGYQITEFIIKGEINVPELRQLVRKILSPGNSGTKEVQMRKDELGNELRKYYDEFVGNLNDRLTDKNVLLQKRKEYKRKYEDLFSRILLADSLNDLSNISEEFRNGW